ncbi:unnamed protein product [Orchesella dallaii]|uniref:Uncharacterized protein n=1 Tax=Orchesella dallaii TaxID=48710 RepID=A0ABP1S0K7_9HEXA
MQVMLQLFLLLSSVFLTYGADPDAMDPSELYPTVNVCNETVLKEFDECWKQLPQAQYQGIPSNPKKIAVACRMQVKMQLFVLLSSVFLTEGAMQDTLEFNTCNETEISEFDECWEKLPEAQYRRIPTNPRKIAVACSVFITGMECVNNWSTKCLSNESIERLNDSILGALQIYQELCQNRKFKEEYHQHMNCFNKVSSHWEACNNKFVGMLEGIQDTNSSQDICW